MAEDFLSPACEEEEEAAAIFVMDMDVVTVLVALPPGYESAVRFSSEADRVLGVRGLGSGVSD